MYSDFKVEVVGKGLASAPITVRVGAKQGCPCSPSIFAAYFDRVYWAIMEELASYPRGIAR